WQRQAAASAKAGNVITAYPPTAEYTASRRAHDLTRTTYNILFTLALPFIILRLLWRAIKAPAYARRWAERFGFVSLTTEQAQNSGRWLWIHAVSVGESIAAAPLV